jgi:hypothetical protein
MKKLARLFPNLLLLSGLSGAMPSVYANISSNSSPLEWQSQDGRSSFKLGGALRANYRDEHWNSDNNGKLLFDIVRIDLKAKHDNVFFDGNFVFQDDEKRSIEHAYVGYKFDQNNQLLSGFIYKPFALYPYPQNGWTFHIPFFVGFGDSVAPGLDWHHQTPKYDLHLAYFPQMMIENLRYSPEVGDYKNLDNTIAAVHRNQANEKRHQLNLRLARKFDTRLGKQEIGLSASAAQLYNSTTDDNGSYSAFALHSINNFNRWNIQSSLIKYSYNPKNPDGVSDDSVLFQANGLTPAYLIAAKATVASLNVAYKIPIKGSRVFPSLKSVTAYNDYSIMFKDKDNWNNSQMNTLGLLFNALPFIVWVDLSWGKNINSFGGSQNSTGYTSTSSVLSDKWQYRTNINIGYYF